MAEMFVMPFRPAYDSSGRTIPGAQAWFTVSGTNTPAPVYTTDALSTPRTNPVVANGVGRFPVAYLDTDDYDYRLRIYAEDAEVGVDDPIEEYDPYIPGMLVDLPLDSHGLIFVTPQQFGAVADDPGTGAFGTDDYPAFAAAIAYIESLAIEGYENDTFYRGAPTFYIPSGGYYLSQSLAPLFTGKIVGEGGKGWGAATRLRFPAGVDGLQLQAHNTSGKTTFDASTHFAGDRLYVSDIAFLGAYSGTESDTHGLRGKRAATIERCTFDNFEGDGLYCNTTFNSGIGSTEGNVNAMRVIDCEFQNCRNGAYFEGDDANAVTLIGCSFINNRKAGIQEDSFLGNHNFGHHFDGNARTADNTGTAAKPASYSYSTGRAYFVIRGQEAWCASNAPSGTTADNTGWGYAWDQGAATPLTGVPAYAGSMTWRAGGPILHDGANNRSTFTGVHVEENGIIQLDQSAMISGFVKEDYVVRVTAATLFRNRVSYILSSSEGILLGNRVVARGDIHAHSTNNYIGPQRGATAVDGTTVLASRSTQHLLEAQIFDSAGTAGGTYASVGFYSGLGIIYDTTAAGGKIHRFRIGAADMAQVISTGLELPAGKVLTVNGTQVVSARGAAVADAAGGATVDTEARAALNALLARLRTHGLIAT